MTTALLVYSTKCKHSNDVMHFINANPSLKQMVQLHDINMYGVPKQYARQISRVPTMLTKNGKILVGQEIRAWLESLLPNQLSNHSLSGGNFASLDGDEGDGGMFNLDSYGQSLQPVITKELQDKISRPVTQGSYSAD